MRSFQKGEDAAFEELVALWYDRAHRYAAALLGDAQLGEDAAQDCFAALYVNKNQYDATLSFEPYFKALIRHKCLDMLKKKKRSPLFLPLEAETLRDASTENAAVDKMYRDSLMGAILALPKEARQMLIAYAMEGKSYKDIASAFRLSAAQVKIRLHRIRKALKPFKEEWK